jgi:hypothetical protein
LGSDQRSDLQSALSADGSFIGFHPGGQHFQESGLAGTVRSDKAYLFGGIDLESRVPKYYREPKALLTSLS